MESQGRLIHGQVAAARESGDFAKALQLSDEAMLAYQQAGDKLGLAELLADRSITFRHLYEKTQDQDFLLIAKGEMEASIGISRGSENNEALAIPLYQLANVETELKQYTSAIDHYKEAISNIIINPEITTPSPDSPAHNRPSYLATIKAHLAYAEYKNGDKNARERMYQYIKNLEEAQEVDSYSKSTWLSGNYMSLAEMLREDNPEEAKIALQKAKEIIDADERLVLRKNQWEKLAQTFS